MTELSESNLKLKRAQLAAELAVAERDHAQHHYRMTQLEITMDSFRQAIAAVDQELERVKGAGSYVVLRQENLVDHPNPDLS